MSDNQSISENPSSPQQTEQVVNSPNVEQPIQQPQPTDFASQFQQNLGLSIEEFREASAKFTQMQETINSYQTQEAVRQQEESLKSAWGISGEEYNSRISQVREEFAKLTPEEQSKFDNPEGAQIIYQRILNRQPKPQQAQVQTAPTFLGSNSTSYNPNTQPKFTASQLRKMPEEEYRSRNAEIVLAYQEGRVDFSA